MSAIEDNGHFHFTSRVHDLFVWYLDILYLIPILLFSVLVSIMKHYGCSSAKVGIQSSDP